MNNIPRNTTLDHRAIREIEDLREALNAWERSIVRVGYDRQYATEDRIAAYDAAAILFECEALTEIADADRVTPSRHDAFYESERARDARTIVLDYTR